MIKTRVDPNGLHVLGLITTSSDLLGMHYARAVERPRSVQPLATGCIGVPSRCICDEDPVGAIRELLTSMRPNPTNVCASVG